MPNNRLAIPKIVWGPGASVGAPASPSATAVGTGGTFAAGTYYWTITTLYGSLESSASLEVSATIALNGSCNLAWTPDSRATGHRIYRGTGAGAENVYQTSGAGGTFTDTGTAGTAGTAPVPNTLNIGYRLDNVKAGDQPRQGSVFEQAPGGVEDAWIVGVDYVLECELRWIPQTNTSSPLATGWDGTTGARAWLAWARQKNIMRFYPDATLTTYVESYLVEPMQGWGDVERDGTRRLPMRLRNSTQSYDGY